VLDSLSLLDLRGYATLEARFGPGPQIAPVRFYRNGVAA